MTTKREISGLKREARERMASTPGLTFEDALDRIARENGFSTWAVLVRNVKCPLAPQQDRAA